MFSLFPIAASISGSLARAHWLEFFIAGDFVGGGYRHGSTNNRRTNNALLDHTA
jgi:hypothetical protein